MEADRRWTKAQAAQTALDMQSACNLTAMLASIHAIGRAFLHADHSTEAANRSAPMRLALHQAVFLATGRELLDSEEYREAATECRRLAGERATALEPATDPAVEGSDVANISASSERAGGRQ